MLTLTEIMPIVYTGPLYGNTSKSFGGHYHNNYTAACPCPLCRRRYMDNTYGSFESVMSLALPCVF